MKLYVPRPHGLCLSLSGEPGSLILVFIGKLALVEFSSFANPESHAF